MPIMSAEWLLTGREPYEPIDETLPTLGRGMGGLPARRAAEFMGG